MLVQVLLLPQQLLLDLAPLPLLQLLLATL